MRPSPFSRARAAAAALALALVLLVPAAAHAYLLTSAADDASNDFIILYSLGYYLSLDPTQPITVFDAADFRAMERDEPVSILAHGEIGKIGGKTSGDLLNLFTFKRLPTTTPAVYLWGCGAGLTGGGYPVSLTMQLGVAMQNAWPGIRTVGPIGCSITDAAIRRANSERVVPPANEGRVAAIQAALEAQYRPQQALDTLIANFRRTHGRVPTLRERAEMAFGCPEVVRFFRDLIIQCDAERLLRPADTGFCHGPGGPC